jgi:transposase
MTAYPVDRRDRVRELVAAGLSYRQVARIVGVSHT